MNIKAIQLFALFFSITGLIFTVNVGVTLDAEFSSPNIEVAETKPAMLQTANVSCKDTEHHGSGDLRARICAHGTTATCDFEDYKLPATDGTCTLDGDGEENPVIKE